jgi:hypothetical protein
MQSRAEQALTMTVSGISCYNPWSKSTKIGPLWRRNVSKGNDRIDKGRWRWKRIVWRERETGSSEGIEDFSSS